EIGNDQVGFGWEFEFGDESFTGRHPRQLRVRKLREQHGTNKFRIRWVVFQVENFHSAWPGLGMMLHAPPRIAGPDFFAMSPLITKLRRGLPWAPGRRRP